jgi:adenylosuccinate synthase
LINNFSRLENHKKVVFFNINRVLMGKHIAVVGLQWGDEGKGKFIDNLTNTSLLNIHSDYYSHLSWSNFLEEMNNSIEKPILAIRYQGGKNAGHSLVINNQRMALHQIPSGIMTPGAFCLMDYGVFLEPRAAAIEIQQIQEQGINIDSSNFGISSKAHVTLDFHLSQDQRSFNLEKWTSTGSGIKQTASDKVNRVGIRFAEFLDKEKFSEILNQRFPNGLFHATNFDEFVASYRREQEFLSQFLSQSHKVKQQHGLNYRFSEGAQGVMLGVDLGDYPGVTSSSPTAVPGRPDTLLGVLKLYCSSVGTGNRAFVSRMPANLESKLHQPWREFGTTTGKLREIGFFDALQAKYATDAAEIDYAAFTCGDRMELLHQMDIRPQIVVGYKIDGKEYLEWDPIFDVRGTRNRAEPIFDNNGEGFEPWEHFVQPGTEKLSDPAQRYIDRIQELIDVDIAYISTGAGRGDVITYRDLLENN